MVAQFPLSVFKFPLLLKLLLLAALCSLSYLIGTHISTTTTATTVSKACTDQFRIQISSAVNTTPLHQFDFQPHHFPPSNLPSSQSQSSFNFTLMERHCPANFSNYCPCQDLTRVKLFSARRFFNRERHCPSSDDKLRCLIPKPNGYRRTFPWPKSRETAWFSNVPFKRLTVIKKSQNWVRLEGDRLVFPGGGTSFPSGVNNYVKQIARILPLKSGSIRTALDVGCGVASFGAALLDYNILTMSFAPQDIHEAQVQFALERGLPAMLGILSTYRLPYPSRSFDMAHCARCLVQWTNYDGLYLLELDRVLRPGGYWVLSGPPINWKANYKGWQRTREDLEEEQLRLEDLAKRLCWKKISEKGNIAVWRKPINHIHCEKKLKVWKSLQFCGDNNPDFAWYKKLDACLTHLPNVTSIDDTSGGNLAKWPRRLNSVPPRIKNGAMNGFTPKSFNQDTELWIERMNHYGRFLGSIASYRNIMDMNAGIGGFASALSKYPVWVMNVVPHDVKENTLGVIYERGLIGTYINWCEAFSTYPRTYDLIHADGIFSFYKSRCDMLDIVLEMYRILRPEGVIVVRDHVDVIVKVKDAMENIGWSSTLSHSEQGPLHSEKLLFISQIRAST